MTCIPSKKNMYIQILFCIHHSFQLMSTVVNSETRQSTGKGIVKVTPYNLNGYVLFQQSQLLEWKRTESFHSISSSTVQCQYIRRRHLIFLHPKHLTLLLKTIITISQPFTRNAKSTKSTFQNDLGMRSVTLVHTRACHCFSSRVPVVRTLLVLIKVQHFKYDIHMWACN